MKFLLTVSIVLGILVLPLKAQFAQSSSAQVALANEQLSKELRNQAQMNYLFGNYLMGVAIENSLKRNFGAEKIRKGQATTRVLASAKNSFVEQGGQKVADKQYIESKLKAFHVLMQKRGLTPYDWADARALAFVLSYQVYFGEDPGSVRLNKFRNYQREITLKDALWQGTPNDELQLRYEAMVIKAISSVVLSQLSEQSGIAAENKQAAREKAQLLAGQVLDEQWDGAVAKITLSDPATGIGFADKGQAVVAAGQGSTEFERSEKILTAKQFNEQYQNRKGEAYYAELVHRFDQEVKRRGGRSNDAAWANAMAFAIVYQVHPKIRVRLNDQQLNWLVREMQSDVLKDTGFQSLTNKEKQEYYERLAIRAMLIADNYNTGTWSKSGDWLGDGIANNLLNGVFAPRRLTDYSLDPKGFVKTN